MVTTGERHRRRDLLILAAILVLAAVLRFANLPSRGEWDDDQGLELLDLMTWVRDGHVPLLGPLSSLGNAHHGVAFYFLLAPGGFMTDNHPVAALATLALIGVAGVAATWWLGSTVGGPLAGHVAALLTAVSPSAIQASTFIWNSNIVGPAAALATAGAWHAWRTERARWWLASAVGVLLMLNGHLLAFLLAVPLAALFVADVVRRTERRRMIWPALGVLAIITIGYLPLIIHELLHDFSEIRGILAYVRGDVEPAGIAPPEGLPAKAMPVIAWRLLVWPMSALVTTAPWWGIPAAVLTFGALVVAATGAAGTARDYGRWAAATTAWAVLAFTLVSPSLAVIRTGLPNDQYHAWLDPVLFGAIGVAVARIAAGDTLRRRITAMALVVGAVALAMASMPPLTSPDGGWTGAQEAAARIREVAGDRSIAVTGVAKKGASLGFPLRRDHADLVPPDEADILVVICDPLFEQFVRKPCGGPAESGVAAFNGFRDAPVIDRFTNGPRRVVTVYARS